MEEMALSEDVKSKWYQALFEEDCIAVMKLLDDYPMLLKVGWKKEPSRQVERYDPRYVLRTKSAWKGRTALHVAASRGCVKLVMQVLRLCNFKDFDVVDRAYQNTSSLLDDFSFSNFQSNRPFRCGECGGKLRGKTRWNSTVKPDYDLCPDCYEEQGNQKEFIKIESGWRKPPVMGSILSISGSDGNATAETTGQSKDSPPDGATVQGDPQRGQQHAQAPEISDLASVDPAARKVQKAASTIVWKNRMDKSEKQASSVGVSYHDVRDLIFVKDGEYGLDVEGIAALHGNWELILLVEYASKSMFGWTRGVETARRLARRVNTTAEKRKLLRQTIVEAELCSPFILEAYNEHRDFNFLPPEEYLIHYLLTWWIGGFRKLGTGLWRAIWSSTARNGGELWRFFLEYRDGRGRPPFHIAMEEHALAEEFLESIMKTDEDYSSTSDEEVSLTTETGDNREVVACAMTTPDAVGRTPIYRAAARGLDKTVRMVLQYAPGYEEVAATCFADWGYNKSEFHVDKSQDLSLDCHRASSKNGFPLTFQLPHTPLHAAMIHGHFGCAKLLIQKWHEFNWGDMIYRSLDEKFMNRPTNMIPIIREETEWEEEYSRCPIEWDLVEFACLAGAPVQLVGFLLDIFEYDLTKTQPSNTDDLNHENTTETFKAPRKHLWHPLHLVASSGRYDMLKYLIDDRNCNPFLEDHEGNSALHHAMKVTEFECRTHLMDYVDAEHVSLSRDSATRMGTKQVLENKSIAERQGCINLLLQAGCDVFKANDRNRLPYPEGSLNDGKFLSWWYEKQEKEFNTTQTNLNFATNAIAVTATLVATASFVGPLQPPLGYDANQIQYENVWVSIFIVCDTISFYFAIIAIIVSLIPALPMPQQAMIEELQRTRGMVTLAVSILLPSIFFVFIAFACSSISVMSANITSEVGGIFTIVSTLVGMILCLLAFALISIRLLAFIYPQDDRVRYIYNISNSLFQRKAKIN